MNTIVSSNHLFVYGTLMRSFTHREAQRFHEGARFIGTARMPGYLYRVSWYPAAVYHPTTESQSVNDWVYGELWLITNNRLLDQIDDYEECTATHPQPHEYVRAMNKIQLIESNQWLTAWVYLYQRDATALQRIADGRFIATNQSI